LHWLRGKSSASCDRSLDPIRLKDVAGFASLAFVTLRSAFQFERRGDTECPAFLKQSSGQRISGREMSHLLARDEWCYGAELAYCSKSEPSFDGDGLIQFCLQLFGVCVEACNAKLPHSSIHLGEVVSYVLYSLHSGDIQTLYQVIGQLERRFNKLRSNLRYKASSNINFSVLDFTDKGASISYSAAVRAPPSKKKKNDSKATAPAEGGRANHRSKSRGRSGSRGRKADKPAKKPQGKERGSSAPAPKDRSASQSARKDKKKPQQEGKGKPNSEAKKKEKKKVEQPADKVVEKAAEKPAPAAGGAQPGRRKNKKNKQ